MPRPGSIAMRKWRCRTPRPTSAPPPSRKGRSGPRRVVPHGGHPWQVERAEAEAVYFRLVVVVVALREAYLVAAARVRVLRTCIARAAADDDVERRARVDDDRHRPRASSTAPATDDDGAVRTRRSTADVGERRVRGAAREHAARPDAQRGVRPVDVDHVPREDIHSQQPRLRAAERVVAGDESSTGTPCSSTPPKTRRSTNSWSYVSSGSHGGFTWCGGSGEATTPSSSTTRRVSTVTGEPVSSTRRSGREPPASTGT